MILYCPQPLEYLKTDDPQVRITLKLPSGGLIMAEPSGHNHLKITDIISTDPLDYVNSRYQPGSLIEMRPGELPED